MTEETFVLRTEVIDLLQVLKATGNAATGGDAKALVDAGLIRVNGETELRRRRKLRSGDVVEWTGRLRISIVTE
ncbi:MAG: RNA-binding S4 domain-containing protein [Flavobacteriales bacterium]